MIINGLVSRRKLKLRGEMVFQQEEGKSINAKVKMEKRHNKKTKKQKQKQKKKIEKRHLLIDFQTPTRSISHSNDWPLCEKQFLIIVFKIFKFIFLHNTYAIVDHTVIMSLHFLKNSSYTYIQYYKYSKPSYSRSLNTTLQLAVMRNIFCEKSIILPLLQNDHYSSWGGEFNPKFPFFLPSITYTNQFLL